MKHIFVNLKRFDIPKASDGICPHENPSLWITGVIRDSAELGLGCLPDVTVGYMLPESLLPTAIHALSAIPTGKCEHLHIGCQSVYRQDTALGGNFGAFTSNRPAAAMAAIGCTSTMIGHSEERKDKLSMLSLYDPTLETDLNAFMKARNTVNHILRDEALCALRRNMDVLFCVGETAQEKGEDDDLQAGRIKAALDEQLEQGLKGLEKEIAGRSLVIAYEPVWAIGPGKTPPGQDYIAFVSEHIKTRCGELFGREIPVLYGGGLKQENAAAIAGVKTVDGGLVALTEFTQPIGFDVRSLKEIIMAYVKEEEADS